MQPPTAHRSFRPVPCSHCRRAVDCPRWRRVALGVYDPLCWACFATSTLLVTMARRSTYASR